MKTHRQPAAKKTSDAVLVGRRGERAHLSLHLAPALLEALTKLAANRGLTRSSLVRALIRAELRRVTDTSQA